MNEPLSNRTYGFPLLLLSKFGMKKRTIVQEVHWTAGMGSPGLTPRDHSGWAFSSALGTCLPLGENSEGSLLFQGEVPCPCPEADGSGEGS